MAITKHNFNGINWGFDTEGLPYKKLQELEAYRTYTLRGCFVTPDHGYGEGAVLITDDALVNVPARYVQTILDIRSDKEDVKDIKAGKVGFHYEMFKSKYGRDGYGIVFDEIK